MAREAAATRSWPNLDPGFVAAVNRRFRGEAVLLAQVDRPPTPRDVGPADLPRDIVLALPRWRDRLAAEDRPNEPHALVRASDDLTVSADYSVIDFATVCAIRDTGVWPPLLSAGALAVCRVRGQVLLQRRSQWVSTYQGSLDIIGGAFQPPAPGFTGDPDLMATIAREFAEETGLALDTRAPVPAVIAGQLRAGFSGYIQLGLAIPPSGLDRMTASREGALLPMDAAMLTAALTDPDERWVPTARLHVLTWLALGARAWPDGVDEDSVFDPSAAKALLDRLIR